MLEDHGEDGNDGALEHRLVCDERHVVVESNHEVALEAAILVLGELLDRTLTLELSQGLDFEELHADSDVVDASAAKARQSSEALLFTASVHQVTRALRHESDHTDRENGGGQKLDANRNQPRRVAERWVGQVLWIRTSATEEVGAVSDPVRDHDTKGDGKLLQSNQSTADLRRSKLSVVQRNQHTEGTDTDTGDESSGENVCLVLEVGLDDHTRSENDTGDHNGDPTSHCIGKPAIDQDTDPSSELQDGREKTSGSTGTVAVPRFHLFNC